MPPAKKKPAPNKNITGKEKLGTGGGEPRSADLAADYNWSMALLNSDPNLRKVFRQAVKQGWSAGRFAAEIQDTPWFKKHASAWRLNENERLTDPATWKAKRKANQATLADAAANMGAVLSPAQLKMLGDNVMSFGLNEAQQRNALAAYIKEQSKGTLTGTYLGQAGEYSRQIRALAKRNGYTIPKGKLDGWLGEIARGDSTVDDYGQMMRRRAADSYPGMADELMAGSDLEDLASPYRQSMATLLEIPEDKIGLNDRQLRRALSHRNDKGKNTPMALYDFEDALRQDDRWQYTDNANEEIMSKTLQVGRMFGKTG